MINRIHISASISLFVFFGLFGFPKYESSTRLNKTNDLINDTLYPSLKAVLIVGPQEKRTKAAIISMNKTAELFKLKGVQVVKFYNNEADWVKIKIASKDANFFIYDGHGSTMGVNGTTGGLCLNSMISSKEIIEGLRFKKNAMVIFKSVCGGAGSSADDNGDIGVDEAVNRVTAYSQPFFEIGVSCYFANNFPDDLNSFLTDFFSEKNIKDCYVKNVQSCNKIELQKEYKYDKNKQISISSYKSAGITIQTSYSNGVKKIKKMPSSREYDVAYVANPNFTIKDMMK